MGHWKTMPLALLLGALLPASAAQAGRSVPEPAGGGAEGMPQRETPRGKVDRPLVMLVCQEVRPARRTGAAAPASNLACVTRWAGL